MHDLDDSKVDVAVEGVIEALEEIKKTLTNANNVLLPNSPLQYNIIQTAAEWEETARSIRFLADMLKANPESLIFGKKSGEEP